MQLDFEIDKLTHSIEDAATGKIFLTEILPLEKGDLYLITKKNGWKFNWKAEFAQMDNQVFKLVLQQQPTVIQGLVCFSVKPDHIFMPLIETAPHNFGKTKKYVGVPGNLVAYVCKRSFELGFDGYLAFIPKTKLIAHYEKTLGAVLFGQRMFIQTQAAISLLRQYYPEFLTN
jgi:hypothetical protein